MMRTLFSLLLGFFFLTEGFTQDFEVDHAQIDIYINPDGYFDVVENYDITFTSPKHGIYRTIQTEYDLQTAEGNQEKRKIKIRNVEVPGHKFSADLDFVQNLNEFYDIKIGDKNLNVFGPQHYEIKYRVYNAFLYEEDVIHFYWNIKPPNWQAIFKKVSFTIHPPVNAGGSVSDFFVYSGYTGTTSESEEFDVRFENGNYSAESRTNFLSMPGMSVTALLNLPPGSVKELKPFWPFWTNYGWTLILGVLVLIFYFIWNKYGKDDKVIAAISYFPPEGIDPAMAGFLIDDSSDTRDLISLIPYWGSRGLIGMEEIPKSGWFGKEDTKLIRLKFLPEEANTYEQEIYTGLFGDLGMEQEILVSSLKDSFYTTMSSAKTLLKQKAQTYYDPKARQVKTLTTVGIVLVGLALFFWFLLSWGLLAAVMVIPIEIFLMIMTQHLVKKNAKGNEMLSDLKGFKQFIKVAEENKLKMLLKEDPTYFETTMAYALAFGMFEQWSKKFETLNLEPPTWYNSPTGVFTMHQFSKSFSGAMSSAQSTMVSSPSSSSSGGGGSSGGGFGGGGGGSW